MYKRQGNHTRNRRENCYRTTETATNMLTNTLPKRDYSRRFQVSRLSKRLTARGFSSQTCICFCFITISYFRNYQVFCNDIFVRWNLTTFGHDVCHSFDKHVLWRQYFEKVFKLFWRENKQVLFYFYSCICKNTLFPG